MAVQKWVLVIDGDSKGAERSIEAVSAKTIAMGNILADIAKGAFNMAVGAVKVLGDELLKSVSAASEMNKRQIAMGAAMKQAGIYTREAFEANLEYASSLQKITTFSDEDINYAQQRLINFGLEGEMLKQVTKATLDLAAASEGDLAGAAEKVARTIGSSSNALGRAGIEISDTTNKTERAAEVVAGISKLFGGSAEAQTRTFSGAIKQLANSWDELYEETGSAITNNTAFISVIDTLKSAVESATDWISKHKEELANLAKDGIVVVIKAVAGLIDAVGFLQGAGNSMGNILLGIFSVWTITAQASLSVLGLFSKGAKDAAKALGELRAAAIEEMLSGSKSNAERQEMIKELSDGARRLAGDISLIKGTYESTTDAVDKFGKNAEKGIGLVLKSEASLIASARGYTEEQKTEYDAQKVGLEVLLMQNKISYEEYYSWLSEKGKNIGDKQAESLIKQVDFFKEAWGMIASISQKYALQILESREEINKSIAENAMTLTASLKENEDKYLADSLKSKKNAADALAELDQKYADDALMLTMTTEEKKAFEYKRSREKIIKDEADSQAKLAAEKAKADKIAADIQAAKDALAISNRKTVDGIMLQAAKDSGSKLIDMAVDYAVKELGVMAALETGKAAAGGFLSFGVTLLAIPLIAAAAAAAKALIHSAAGFAEGGEIGAGGSRLPFPSMAGGGMTATGAPVQINAHVGELVGTPARLAAAGVGGVTVFFNNYGALSSNIDVENMGDILGGAIQNKLRGGL